MISTLSPSQNYEREGSSRDRCRGGSGRTLGPNTSILGRHPAHFLVSFGRFQARFLIHFHTFFKSVAGPSSRNVLEDPRNNCKSPLIRRSAVGLVAVYNQLPTSFLDAKTVPLFQRKLQDFVKARAVAGCADWKESLSPRMPLEGHPVLSADIMDV